MLYEVITREVFSMIVAEPPAIRAESTSAPEKAAAVRIFWRRCIGAPALPCKESSFPSRPSGRDQSDDGGCGEKQRSDQAGIRITSYNVCYTKLLRTHYRGGADTRSEVADAQYSLLGKEYVRRGTAPASLDRRVGSPRPSRPEKEAPASRTRSPIAHTASARHC